MNAKCQQKALVTNSVFFPGIIHYWAETQLPEIADLKDKICLTHMDQKQVKIVCTLDLSTLAQT